MNRNKIASFFVMLLFGVILTGCNKVNIDHDRLDAILAGEEVEELPTQPAEHTEEAE